MREFVLGICNSLAKMVLFPLLVLLPATFTAYRLSPCHQQPPHFPVTSNSDTTISRRNTQLIRLTNLTLISTYISGQMASAMPSNAGPTAFKLALRTKHNGESALLRYTDMIILCVTNLIYVYRVAEPHLPFPHHEPH